MKKQELQRTPPDEISQKTAVFALRVRIQSPQANENEVRTIQSPQTNENEVRVHCSTREQKKLHCSTREQKKLHCSTREQNAFSNFEQI